MLIGWEAAWFLLVKFVVSINLGIRIINLVYFSQIINLLPHADSADLRRICESLRPHCHPDGTREFTMRVLRKSAESA